MAPASRSLTLGRPQAADGRPPAERSRDLLRRFRQPGGDPAPVFPNDEPTQPGSTPEQADVVRELALSGGVILLLTTVPRQGDTGRNP